MQERGFNLVREARISTLAWLGPVSAAITIFSNLDGVINFSKLVSRISGYWREIIAWPALELFEIINVQIEEFAAQFLTILAIFVIVGLSARGHAAEHWTYNRRFAAALLAAAVGSLYVLGAMNIVAGNRAETLPADTTIIIGFIFMPLITILSAPVFFFREVRQRWLATLVGALIWVLCLRLFILLAIGYKEPKASGVFEQAEFMFLFLCGPALGLIYFSNPIPLLQRNKHIIIFFLALAACNLITLTVE